MSIPWADQPYPLLSTELPNGYENASDGSIAVFTAMTLAHNMIIRHLNAIYLQATGVTEAVDTRDFLFFCKTWLTELHGHHDGEESILFPMLDKYTGVASGAMGEAEEQHGTFRDGVDEMAAYVERISMATNLSEYSGRELRRIIRGFAPPLMRHLREEPGQLLAIGERVGGTGLKKVWDEFEARLIREGMAKWDKHVMLPVVLGTNDHDFNGGAHTNFPPFPFFLPFLIRVYFAKRHAGAWRFFPCWNSRRRELAFVGEGWEDALEGEGEG
ncbi:hypothetical protein ASPCAL01869 [Aspergillus calidoustus]|uniref:Hemerythrin-like domain-containing protein n=1 Tax=Aspergillus calidoustus TaxID=454130 RepID=A0A0U5GL82_ASPCI|nr:hypothetical protein ASPCAL01869 [Aspergillus calidoustus]